MTFGVICENLEKGCVMVRTRSARSTPSAEEPSATSRQKPPEDADGEAVMLEELGEEGDAISRLPQDSQNRQYSMPPPTVDILDTLSEDTRQAVERLIAKRTWQIYEGRKREEEAKHKQGPEEDVVCHQKIKRADEVMQSQANKKRKLSIDADEVLPPSLEQPS